MSNTFLGDGSTKYKTLTQFSYIKNLFGEEFLEVIMMKYL